MLVAFALTCQLSALMVGFVHRWWWRYVAEGMVSLCTWPQLLFWTDHCTWYVSGHKSFSSGAFGLREWLLNAHNAWRGTEASVSGLYSHNLQALLAKGCQGSICLYTAVLLPPKQQSCCCLQHQEKERISEFLQSSSFQSLSVPQRIDTNTKDAL